MKANDLLHYMELTDPKFVEEASDRNLLLYRRRRRRTCLTAAACLALVVLAGVMLREPAVTAWELRNTVTSWRDNGGFVYLEFDKPSPSVFVSAEMPDQKKFAADTPFTLSVGLGQVSDYEFATLSIHAAGFEITDKDGNTAQDRYVRTLSDFDSEDYGVLYRDGKPSSPVTGCQYLEDFTFRFTGSENTTGWGVIEFSLQSRTENSSMGDYVTVYYTIQNGVLKLTDKNPVRDGSQNGGQATVLHPEEETEPGTVTLSKEDFSIRVEMPSGALTPGQFLGDKFHVTAFYIPTQKDYPTHDFTAELVYAESLREKDFSFFIKKPTEKTENGSYISIVPRVPTDAPIGSYDLRVTDPATGFVWVFENMALVLPANIPAYEDLVCEATVTQPSLTQGEQWMDKISVRITLNGESYTLISCGAFLQYSEKDVELDYIIPIFEPMYSSYLPPSYIPTDAPMGSYTLVVTDTEYGYTWSFADFLEITENPDAQRFGFYHDMEKKLTVSRSSELTYTFTAIVENRGDPFTVTETADSGFKPEAKLTEWQVSGGTPDSIPLLAITGPYQEPFERTVQTGDTASLQYEILVTPETPCGLYALVLSYGDCVQVFVDVVEVVP